MRAKEALKKTTGVRKTRNGNILVELIKAKASANEISEKIKTVTEDRVQSIPLQTMVSLEVKNIDPLSKEELRSDICSDLSISNRNCVDVKTLPINPRGI